MASSTQITQPGGNTKSPGKRRRAWCFTVNNFSEDEFTQLHSTFKSMKGVKYTIGKEIGEKCKTPHLQGYVRFPNGKSFNAVRKIIPRAHIEGAHGDDSANYSYCAKGQDFVSNMNIDSQSSRDALVAQILKDEYSNVPGS